MESVWGGGGGGPGRKGLPFGCLPGSQMQFIDNIRGAHDEKVRQPVRRVGRTHTGWQAESQRQLYENATFMPLCWLFTHTVAIHTDTHTAPDVEGIAPKAQATAQNLCNKLWQQILAQTIFSWLGELVLVAPKARKVNKMGRGRRAEGSRKWVEEEAAKSQLLESPHLT